MTEIDQNLDPARISLCSKILIKSIKALIQYRILTKLETKKVIHKNVLDICGYSHISRKRLRYDNLLLSMVLATMPKYRQLNNNTNLYKNPLNIE